MVAKEAGGPIRTHNMTVRGAGALEERRDIRSVGVGEARRVRVIVLIMRARGGGVIPRGEVCPLSVFVVLYRATSPFVDITDRGLPRSFAGHGHGVGLQLSNHFAIGRPAWEFLWIGGPSSSGRSSDNVGPGEGDSR